MIFDCSQLQSQMTKNTDFVMKTNPYDIKHIQDKTQHDDLVKESIPYDLRSQSVTQNSKHQQIYLATLFSLLTSVNLVAKFENTGTKSENMDQSFQKFISDEMLEDPFTYKSVYRFTV